MPFGAWCEAMSKLASASTDIDEDGLDRFGDERSYRVVFVNAWSCVVVVEQWRVDMFVCV